MDKKTERTAECRCCGQQRLIQCDSKITDEEAIELVTLECNCSEGREYRAEQEEKKRINQMIEDSKSITFEQLGNDMPEIETFANTLIPEMVKFNIPKLAIMIEKTKISIKYSGDKITISRTDTKKQQDEAIK